MHKRLDSIQTVIGSSNGKWLDLGCGTRILPRWSLYGENELIKKCKMLVGIDYDLDSLMRNNSIGKLIRGDIVKLPFKDDSFDVATANMVIEHLENPEAIFEEVRRILKQGGTFVFHTPNIYGYSTILARLTPQFIKGKIIHFLQGRKEDDIFKTYYRANTINKIKAIADSASIIIESQKLVVSTPNFVFVPIMLPFELLWIRLLMSKWLRSLRTSIITILKKV